MSHSIAVKCIYNDADEGPLVGFKGVCSLELMRRYVQCKELYCGSEACPCHTYYFRDRTQGERPAYPCMESRLFRDWEVAPNPGPASAKGRGQEVNGARLGGFAVLTTTFLGGLESERVIIGLFQIGEIAREGESVRVIAAPNGRIRLPLEAARRLLFWAYCDSGSHRPEWRHDIYRSLEDGQVHRILVDVAETVRDENAGAELDRLVQSAFGSGPAPQASGCLRGKITLRKARAPQARKYGLGGEGQAHRKLNRRFGPRS
jgi:hypothetical protein